jgi:hypothetical protein
MDPESKVFWEASDRLSWTKEYNRSPLKLGKWNAADFGATAVAGDRLGGKKKAH